MGEGLVTPARNVLKREREGVSGVGGGGTVGSPLSAFEPGELGFKFDSELRGGGGLDRFKFAGKVSVGSEERKRGFGF